MNEADELAPAPVVSIPTPSPVAVKVQEPKIVQVTKFFSWLTACILAISVLVSLYGVTTERNDLRDQVGELSDTLNCRAANTFLVTRASADKQIALANEMVNIGEFVILYLDVQTGVVTAEDAIAQAPELRESIENGKIVLEQAAINLQNAVNTVDRALETCGGD
jgi:hypothetical protein